MKYISGKLIQSIVTLLLISIIVFIAVRASGDPIENLLPTNSTLEQRELLTSQLGLDKPVVAQYFIFISNAIRGNFGTSYSSRRPVLTVIWEKLPYTLELAIAAILFALLITIIFGSLAAIKKDTILDKIISGFAAFFQATPTFFLAIIAVQLFGVRLRILPVSGAGTLLHLILPAGLLGFGISSNMVMLLRNNMIAVMESEFIKFTRLKGLSEYKVILKHALRNSFSSVLALSSFIFAHLIAGSVAIEAIFAWPGVGTLSYNAVIARDFPLVQGIVLILSAFTILLSFVIDSVTAVVDPRIRKSM